MASSTTDTLNLPLYAYRPLQGGHFRFIELLPGVEGDPIRIRIYHSPIYASLVTSRPRMRLREVRATLPEGWHVELMRCSRYLFSTPGRQPSWTHPNPDIEPSSYLVPQPEHIPKFEAVSYAWGTDTALLSITVDQKPGQPSFSLLIRPNLMVALEHLRNPSTVRTLWVDAICINQADFGEKAIQVSKMSTIFSQAYRVIVWLGPKQADSDRALRALKILGTKWEWTWTYEQWVSPDATEDWRLLDVSSILNNEVEEAIRSLLRRPWFSRLWVVQEAGLASTLSVVQCGHVELLLRQFRNSLFYLLLCEGGMSWASCCTPLSMCSRPEGPRDGFRRVLWDLASLECSDPRDRIYGLLGVLSQSVVQKIEPDYHISVKELYKQVVLKHANSTGAFELWFDHLVSGEEQWDADRTDPTWVPDWSLKQRNFWLGDSNRFAAGLSRVDFEYEDPGILVVRGVICGTIATVSDIGPSDPHVSIEEGARWLQHSQPPLEEFYRGLYRPTGDPISLAHVANLSGFQYKERFVDNCPSSSMPTIDEWKSSIYITSTQEAMLSRANRGTLIPWTCCRVIANKRYVTTEEGHMGLAPGRVRREDKVVVLLGCSSPIILRPRSNGHFSMMGEAIIYGLQDGRALLGPVPTPWKTKTDPGYLWLKFFNEETGKVTDDDPRLHPLGEESEWQPDYVSEALPRGGYQHYRIWKNKRTGETCKHDPRMSPDALRERGVDLVTLRIE
ncbi:Heterokaryon incompatibility protein (HET) domain containing protein [Naviculisporaceae sp. PSN 640]